MNNPGAECTMVRFPQGRSCARPYHEIFLGLLSTFRIEPRAFSETLGDRELGGFSRELFLEEVGRWESCGYDFDFQSAPLLAMEELIGLIKDCCGASIHDLGIAVEFSDWSAIASSMAELRKTDAPVDYPIVSVDGYKVVVYSADEDLVLAQKSILAPIMWHFGAPERTVRQRETMFTGVSEPLVLTLDASYSAMVELYRRFSGAPDGKEEMLSNLRGLLPWQLEALASRPSNYGVPDWALPMLREFSSGNQSEAITPERARSCVAQILVAPSVRFDASINVPEVAYWLRRSACTTDDGAKIVAKWLAMACDGDDGSISDPGASASPATFLLLHGLLEADVDVWQLDREMARHHGASFISDLLMKAPKEFQFALSMPGADPDYVVAGGRTLLNIAFWRALVAAGKMDADAESHAASFYSLLSAGANVDTSEGAFPLRRVALDILSEDCAETLFLSDRKEWNAPGWAADSLVHRGGGVRPAAGQFLAAMEAADLSRQVIRSEPSLGSGHI